MKQKFLQTIASAIILLIFSLTFAFAQDKRISFAKGKTVAVVSGKLKKGGETQYVFRARKGQRAIIKLTADNNDNDTYFSLAYADGFEAVFLDFKGRKYYTQEEVETVFWDGRLPKSDENDYYIRVVSKKRAVGYKLEVTLK
ncbi:MAG: hypothetical protein M3033_03605 [Acidobacteriota bacterium]|nr:hypothetical protein [Acidobacteriota bacterium]